MTLVALIGSARHLRSDVAVRLLSSSAVPIKIAQSLHSPALLGTFGAVHVKHLPVPVSTVVQPTGTSLHSFKNVKYCPVLQVDFTLHKVGLIKLTS